MDTIAQRPSDLPHDHAVAVPTSAYVAYRFLQIAFVGLPIIAGVDKFLNKLTTWDMYLANPVVNALGGHTHAFMMVAGAVEIVAGILVALKPKVFAWIVALWLLGIIINLCLTGMFYDIILRDAALCLSAIALACLARPYDFGPIGGLLRCAHAH